MRNRILLLLLLVQSLAYGQDWHFDQNLTTIAIGSCNRQDLPQTIWSSINQHNPDLWIWLGDNIYGDTDDMKVMKAKYDQQKSGEGYTQLRQNSQVIGIWDDHDFGVNDGGKEYQYRMQSRDLMFDFLDVPKGSPAYKREGGYQSYTFGDNGRKVKVILLDARYFRDALVKKGRRNAKNWDGKILGEDQWAWLEKELTDSDADMHILAGGIQFIATEHRFEKWDNFPKERQRLLDLLVDIKPKNAFILSGDRHISEIASMYVPGYGMIYDFTSSGMTHSYEASTEYNSYRMGKLITEKSFGLIKIDWSGEKPKMAFEIRRDDNKLLDGPIQIFE